MAVSSVNNNDNTVNNNSTNFTNATGLTPQQAIDQLNLQYSSAVTAAGKAGNTTTSQTQVNQANNNNPNPIQLAAQDNTTAQANTNVSATGETSKATAMRNLRNISQNGA